MDAQITLEGPTFGNRMLFSFFCLGLLSFGTVFISLPLWHLGSDILTGSIPWPLVGFAALAVPLGVLFIAMGFRLRVWILPYRFTVDAQARICGYLWKDHWFGKIDLTGLSSLMAEPVWSRWLCRWVIYANFEGDRKRGVILNSHSSFSTEHAAYQQCLKSGRKIARHLSVDFEMVGWSKDVGE